MRSRGAALGGIVAWLVLGIVGPAAAACPTFNLEQTVLALYALEGRNLSATQRQALVNSGVIRGFPGGLVPSRGPAPLRVGLFWMQRPENPLTIELDADGDGVPDITSTRDEDFGYTYGTPGQYAATIRVRELGGRMKTYRSPVVVLSPEAFEAELQDRWASLREALERGDGEAALECVQSTARQRLDRVLAPFLRKTGDYALPAIRFVESRVIEAVYETTRPPAGVAQPLDVRFQLDLDGVWRLGSLRPKEAP